MLKRLDLNLRPQVKARELVAKRRVLSKILEGMWSAMLRGRGMEFAGFRTYTPSDDASRIDWGASLRSKEILVREFEEYKSVNVIFLFDVSSTMLFSSQRKLKVEYAAETIFQIALSILENGDAVGYVMFNENVVAKELPGVGRGVVYSMINSFSNPKNYGGKKNFANVVGVVNAMMKQRALVVLVSDFIGMGEGWDRYIKLLSEKFDLIGIMVRDPRDRQFPESGSQFLLEDPLTSERMFVDIKDMRAIFEQQAQEDEVRIKNVFAAAKAGFVSISTDEEDLLRPIMNYFKRRTTIVR